MPRCRAVSHDFPDCCFYQMRRPLVRETALDLFDAGDFSPGPDLLQGDGNVSKDRKRPTPRMQEDQIVVACPGQRSLGSDTEEATLDMRKPACGLSFCQVAITPFVIFHASLGDEKGSIREHPYHIGQVVMRLPFKCVADGKGRVLVGRQSVGCGPRWSNVATRIADYLGVIFEPQKKAFFQLATKWLPDVGCHARLKTGNPPRNGATCYFEQINPIDSRCDHQHSSSSFFPKCRYCRDSQNPFPVWRPALPFRPFQGCPGSTRNHHSQDRPASPVHCSVPHLLHSATCFAHILLCS